MAGVLSTGAAERLAPPRLLPGFGLTLGVTLLYAGVMIALPFAALFARAAGQPWEALTAALSHERTWSAIKLTFWTATAAAAINAVFGTVVAWMLERERFPGRTVLDALIDLPFALPAAVGGIALTTLYVPTGLFGAPAHAAGIPTAFSAIGVIIAMLFVGLPFVVRSVQPALRNLDHETEEAAHCLGASAPETFRRVILPPLLPHIVSGFALALARGLGEFGAVIFISGNIPYRTEFASLLIAIKLDEYDYAGATAIALVMLSASFFVLLAVHFVEAWASRRGGGDPA